MLVLTRLVGEKISIDLGCGKQMVVTVTKITKEGRVKLGFEAPSDVLIVRPELLLRKPRTEKQLDELIETTRRT
jgi:carbon storage regulator CsrA